MHCAMCNKLGWHFPADAKNWDRVGAKKHKRKRHRVYRGPCGLVHLTSQNKKELQREQARNREELIRIERRAG